MIALLQRVSRASVTVENRLVARIGRGLLILVGVEKDDSATQAARLAERIAGYRIFSDDSGRMNLDVRESGGAVLLVPQFTLAADTRKGRRPSFTSAAPPAEGSRLFDALVAQLTERLPAVHTGEFGANMAVELVNDGPVTFWLQV